jgi:hypothetical protein
MQGSKSGARSFGKVSKPRMDAEVKSFGTQQPLRGGS